MGIRLNKAVTIVIDGSKVPVDELIQVMQEAIRLAPDEQLMMRLSSVYKATDQRDRDTATIELSTDKVFYTGTGSNAGDGFPPGTPANQKVGY